MNKSFLLKEMSTRSGCSGQADAGKALPDFMNWCGTTLQRYTG
jgi:hypothetical protein